MSHLILRTHDGKMLGALQGYTGFEFARSANAPGWFRIATTDLDPRFLWVDNIIEFYRDPPNSGPVLMGVGLLRKWTWIEMPNGVSALGLEGPDQIDLLDRRIVAYTDPEAFWNKTGPADDLMKEVVSENMGPTATDPWYNRGRAYNPNYFSIAPDEGKGRSVTKEFQFRNTLAVLQDLADASKWPSSSDNWAGSPVWFDCEYTGPGKFMFRTWSPLRGIDRTMSGKIAPLIFSREAGNINNPVLTYDYSDERNIVYGLGPGQGESRMVDPENDVPREYLSIWNLRESSVPATEETTLQGIAYHAFDEMQKMRPKVKFQGDLLDTPHSRFGVDWGYGDMVTVRYRNMEFDGRVDKFTFAVDQAGKETITAQIEVPKALEGKPDLPW